MTPTIVIDSCFPGGNIASAAIVNPSPLTIEIEGNTDVNLDNSSKYWLYFRIRGFRKDRPIKMVVKNANHLRKYMGQNRIRPYMVYKDETDDNWKPVLAPI